MLIAFASYIGFKLHQKYVKSVFLDGYLKEMFVCQTPGFENHEFSEYEHKLDTSLYGLK